MTQHTPEPLLCSDCGERTHILWRGRCGHCDAALILAAPALAAKSAERLAVLKDNEFAIPHYSLDTALGDPSVILYRTCAACGGPDRPDWMGPEGHFPGCEWTAAIEDA